MSEGFILCIGMGGLTDFTTEIWACREYAIKHNRSLIIEKAYYRSDLLSELFDFTTWPIPVYFIDKLYSVTHTDIEPIVYREFLTYDNQMIKSFKICKDMRFDMNRSYSRDTLLIHCSLKCRIPNYGHLFLRSVGFTEDFVGFLKEHMSLLPPMYNVSHIRHTDYTVNLEKTYQYIERLMASSTLPLYLATDNISVLNTLIEKYGTRILYNRSILEVQINEKRKTLHHSDGKNILHNAILDLFILAKGANSVIPQYRVSGSAIHGYTQLVDLLHADTSFIDRLLA